VSVDHEEMIRILEEIIRDPDSNPTARCTAIGALREIPQEPAASAFADLDPDGFELRCTGRDANS
jgi:hypothetical protein